MQRGGLTQNSLCAPAKTGALLRHEIFMNIENLVVLVWTPEDELHYTTRLSDAGYCFISPDTLRFRFFFFFSNVRVFERNLCNSSVPQGHNSLSLCSFLCPWLGGKVASPSHSIPHSPRPVIDARFFFFSLAGALKLSKRMI